jgi:cytochrome c oxidase subunit 4
MMNREIESSHEHATTGLYVKVWTGLIVLTLVEIFLAYVHLLSLGGMIFLLMALSLVKSGLIVAYFMHLKFERMNLVLSLVPSVVLVIALLSVFFPDSFRLAELRVQ